LPGINSHESELEKEKNKRQQVSEDVTGNSLRYILLLSLEYTAIINLLI